MDTLLLRPDEVAKTLSVGRSTVYELMRSGALISVRIGACRRVPRAAVQAYVEALSSSVSAS